MSYRFVDHTSEVEMELDAETEEGVFSDALLGLAELIGEGSEGEEVRRHLSLERSGRELLLVGWLDELVYLSETEDLVPEAVDQLTLSDDRLAAAVRFRRGNPRALVKGVTYHQLVFERAEGGIHARVVFDV
jgi:SHS2 domain-containing protein